MYQTGPTAVTNGGQAVIEAATELSEIYYKWPLNLVFERSGEGGSTLLRTRIDAHRKILPKFLG